MILFLSTAQRKLAILIVLIICCISIYNPIYGQSQINYFEKFNHYINQNNYDSALVVSDLASQYFAKEKDTLSYLYTKFIFKAYAYKNKGDFLKAHLAMEQLNNEMEALKYSENNVIVYYYFFTYGLVYARQDDYKMALKCFNYALYYGQKIYNDDSDALASLYTELSNAHRLSGEYEEALKYIYQSKSVYLSKGDSLSYGTCLVNESNVYALTGEYQLAIDCCKKVKSLYERKYPDMLPSTLPAIYNNMGVSNLYWDKHKEAIAYFKEAKSAVIAMGSDPITLARIWFNMGYSYEKLDSLREAAISEKNAQDLLLAQRFTNDALLSWSYNISAKVELKKNELSKALEFVQRSLYQNASGFGRWEKNEFKPYYQQDDKFHNPLEINCYDHSRLLESIILKMDIFGRMNKKGNYTEVIKNCISDADNTVTTVKNKYTSDKDKVELMKHSFDLSDRAVNFYFKEYQKDKKPENLQTAFRFAEKAKASILLEVLRTAEVKSFAGVPKEIVSKGDSIQDLISYKSESAKRKTESERNKIREEIHEMENYFDRYLKFLKENYPDYYDLKYADKVVDIPQLQTKIDSQTTVLSYFIGDSTLTVFAINKSSSSLYQQQLPKDLGKKLKGLRSSILYKNDDLFKGLAHEIYAQLFFFPIPAQTKELIIVPHDYLCSLPFEALLEKPATDNDISQWDFLINRYDISYAYSVSLLDRMLKKGHQVTKKQFLGIAPVFKGNNTASGELKRALANTLSENEEENTPAEISRTFNGNSITPIPGTEVEVKTIQNLFESQKKTAQIFLNSNASEDNIKKHPLGDYMYIHIATHGFVDNVHPENSGIILHPTEAKNEDNVLYARELYNLNLNANLMVLSACETGLGSIKKGEGLIGLTRPLLFAGAKNIMVSLWKVSDASTTELMIHFYNNIWTKNHYNKNLSLAKRKMIQGKQFAQPYYWAAFVLIGE